MGDPMQELEAQRQRDKENRRLAGEAMAVLMEYGPEIGVRLTNAVETHMAVEVYESASYAVTLQVTPKGLKLLAEAVREANG